MTMTNTRRRGRPALREGEASWPVSVRFPDSEYDDLCAMSNANRMSIPEMLRGSVRVESIATHTLASIDARLEAIEAKAVLALDLLEREHAEEDAEGFSESLRALLRKEIGLEPE